MIIRSMLFLLSALTALPTAFTQDVYPSSKRGLVYVPSAQHPTDDNIWDHAGSDLTWYYTYGATPAPAFYGTQLQFVPMLWGAPPGGASDTTFLSQVEGLIQNGQNISYALGFNEPDGSSSTGGSNVAPSYAAQIWATNIQPLKQKYGIQLGAPAVTGAPSGFDWMTQFFGNCSGNCSVDFIPIHWYGNFEGLASHVEQYYGAYPNMSLWVTEYTDPDDTLSGTETFFNQSASWFDSLE
jgi:Glycosyl hydrolase catalytic core